MYTKTRAIVLHTVKYSETSVIAKIYTEDLGLLSFIIKGVRSAKSKSKASMMQPLSILEMELQYREARNLQFAKEFNRAYVYQSLPFDILKSTIAIFLLEVVTKSIREHEPNNEMFEFIYESLVELDKQQKLNPDFHLLFMVHFTRYLGFAPHGNYSELNCCFEMQEGVFTNALHQKSTVMNKNESRILNELLQTPLYLQPATKITRTERRDLLRQLSQYYRLHIENFNLKSLDVLEEVIG